MNNVLEKIKSRGYWKVIIRPATYIKDRITPINALFPILAKTSVQLLGWDFPHLDRQNIPHIDLEYISQEIDWNHEVEIWRFYQSGQFIHFAGINTDWRDQSELWPPSKDWELGKSLGICNTVYRYTEIFEFASRLALTAAGDNQMKIDVTLNGLEGRRLVVDHPRRGTLSLNYTASLKEFPYGVTLAREELIAEPRKYALEPSLEFFRRFGWEPSLEVLRDIQGELRR